MYLFPIQHWKWPKYGVTKSRPNVFNLLYSAIIEYNPYFFLGYVFEYILQLSLYWLTPHLWSVLCYYFIEDTEAAVWSVCDLTDPAVLLLCPTNNWGRRGNYFHLFLVCYNSYIVIQLFIVLYVDIYIRGKNCLVIYILFIFCNWWINIWDLS